MTHELIGRAVALRVNTIGELVDDQRERGVIIEATGFDARVRWLCGDVDERLLDDLSML